MKPNDDQIGTIASILIAYGEFGATEETIRENSRGAAEAVLSALFAPAGPLEEVAGYHPERFMAEAEATARTDVLRKLIISAKMLQQNAEGCVAGMPGWLIDTKADIAAADALLTTKGTAE